jgi:DNA replication protein DnaC
MTIQAPSGVYEQLKDDLGYLKLTRAAELLPGLLDRARTDGLSHAQFEAELVAPEAAATRNRRMAARLRFAHFPARRTLDEFDFDFQPSAEGKLIGDLASLRFVVEGRPLLLLGQPGCGKSHLAIALATLAVEAGYRGYFTSAADLVATIAGAYADGTFATQDPHPHRPSVLVIDDAGLTPMDRAAGNTLFQVVNRRYDNNSTTIVTTNRSLPAWASCSATRWSPPRSWTGCCTGPWSSTSRAPAGAYASTKAWSTGPQRGWALGSDPTSQTLSSPNLADQKHRSSLIPTATASRRPSSAASTPRRTSTEMV